MQPTIPDAMQYNLFAASYILHACIVVAFFYTFEPKFKLRDELVVKFLDINISRLELPLQKSPAMV